MCIGSDRAGKYLNIYQVSMKPKTFVRAGAGKTVGRAPGMHTALSVEGVFVAVGVHRQVWSVECCQCPRPPTKAPALLAYRRARERRQSDAHERRRGCSRGRLRVLLFCSCYRDLSCDLAILYLVIL